MTVREYSDHYPTVDEVLDSSIAEVPRLHKPVMLVALEGWFDATKAATAALNWLTDSRHCVTVATIDPDPFFDFTQVRPEVWIDDDDERHVRWPENDIMAVRGENDGRDLVVLSGVEPHLHWPTFVSCIVRCARDLRCGAVVTVGAMLDAVPHTRTPTVTGSTTNSALASKLGLSRPQYEGPTGIIGVLLERLEQERIPAISLRVGVPHYLAASEHPKSSAALLRHLERVLNVPTQHAGLYEEIQRWSELHDAAVEEDEQTSEYVQMLEGEYDRRNDTAIPTADDLGDAFERFLREQSEDD
jgi:proteasome assembly chaperone (PAC2) family protein